MDGRGLKHPDKTSDKTGNPLLHLHICNKKADYASDETIVRFFAYSPLLILSIKLSFFTRFPIKNVTLS